MPILKRVAFTTVSALVAFLVLWMVIVNDQAIALNLIFVQTPSINAGLVILLALLLGLLMGFLLGLLRARWSKPSV
ncbi:MAG: lipopolysaccharide assembly protein LapA domain-containing protein [Pseudomonadota bacterium]